ncbi:hypothetical protein SGL43_00500 [Streptomyces globisporus]|uniref:Uncharacterized protein n=1 Tax=Streptomyces globisporus TaxID=1908 RepID=A0ABM9GRM2_STRGL|nr:hypothetical protein SGL43_00500 [Streptomyces globisporus]
MDPDAQADGSPEMTPRARPGCAAPSWSVPRSAPARGARQSRRSAV